MGGIKSEKENLNTCKHISGVSSYTSICKLLGVDAFIYRIYTNRKAGSFDEPTSGLDYRHMLQVARLFEKLRNHGKTILVVTHDLEFIEALHANTICLEELQA